MVAEESLEIAVPARPMPGGCIASRRASRHLLRLLVAAWLAWLLPCSTAGAADLRILVETSTDMPMAEVKDGQLIGGIHKDVGELLARQLRRRALFELLPRKRIVRALERGDADLSCHYLPAWLPGDLEWSIPFLPNALLLINDRRAERSPEVFELGNEPVGTVLGFVYPDLTAVLGAHFERSDAPNSLANIRRLAAGHLRHALVGQVFLSYQQRTGAFAEPIYPPIVIRRYEAQCAVSRRGQVDLAQVNAAIQAIKRGKELETMYARYR